MIKRGKKRIVLSDCWAPKLHTWLEEGYRNRILMAFDDNVRGQCLVTDAAAMIALYRFEYKDLLLDRLGRMPTPTEPILMVLRDPAQPACPIRAAELFQAADAAQGIPASILPWIRLTPSGLVCRVVATQPGHGVRKAFLYQEQYMQIFNPEECTFSLLINTRGRPLINKPNTLLAVRVRNSKRLIGIAANVLPMDAPDCEKILRFLARRLA